MLVTNTHTPVIGPFIRNAIKYTPRKLYSVIATVSRARVWSLLPFYQLRGKYTPRWRPECPTAPTHIYYSLSSFSITRLVLARCRYYIILLAQTVIVHTQNRTREEKSYSALVATAPRPFYLTIKSTFRRKYIYIYIYKSTSKGYYVRVKNGGVETV